MIVRQKIEQIRPGVIKIIFCVICFVTKASGPNPEIDRQAFPNGCNVSAISLPYRPINIWPRFIRRISLNAFGRLAELKVYSIAPAAAFFDVWSIFDDKIRLIKAETIM